MVKAIYPCGHPLSWLFQWCPICAQKELHKELVPDNLSAEGDIPLPISKESN